MTILTKIKKSFSFFAKKNKFLIVCFIFLSFFWPNSAYAIAPLVVLAFVLGGSAIIGWVGKLIGYGLPQQIAYWIFTLFFNILGAISIGFANLAAGILEWVLSPDFTTLSYTNPAGNPVIDAGLSITQGFVNILLILILIYISLAVILRIAGYEIKKLLPTFLIVALLVNFAPVICGIIVDASNIVMYYFVINVTEYTKFSTQLGNLWKDFAHSDAWGSEEKMAGAFFQSLIITLFGFAAALVLTLYWIIFIFRYIAIWILVILSPLAFGCYVLPVTKKYFMGWWNQLLQWSFVGVTAGFFLYLGTILLSEMNRFFTAPTSDLEQSVTAILPSLVPITLLYIGLFAGFSTSAVGASAIINFSKGQGKRAGTWASSKGKKMASKQLLGPAAERAAKGFEKFAQWKNIKNVPMLGALARAPITPLTDYAAGQQKIDLPKNWDNMTIAAKERVILGQKYAKERVTLASKMKDEGTFQKASKEFQNDIIKSSGKLSSNINSTYQYSKEIANIFESLPDKITEEIAVSLAQAKFNPRDKINRANEETKIRTAIGGKATEYGIDRNVAAGVLLVEGFKSKDVTGVSSNSAKSEAFQLGMRRMKSNVVRTVHENFDSDTVEEIFNQGRGLNKTNQDERNAIKNVNESLDRWAERNPVGREILNWYRDGSGPTGSRTPTPTPPTPTTPTTSTTSTPTPPGGHTGGGTKRSH